MDAHPDMGPLRTSLPLASLTAIALRLSAAPLPLPFGDMQGGNRAPAHKGINRGAWELIKLINKIGPKNILQYMAPQAAGTGLKGRGRSN